MLLRCMGLSRGCCFQLIVYFAADPEEHTGMIPFPGMSSGDTGTYYLFSAGHLDATGLRKEIKSAVSP